MLSQNKNLLKHTKINICEKYHNKAPHAETEEDWKKISPWNIEITPYKISGEWL